MSLGRWPTQCIWCGAGKDQLREARRIERPGDDLAEYQCGVCGEWFDSNDLPEPTQSTASLVEPSSTALVVMRVPEPMQNPAYRPALRCLSTSPESGHRCDLRASDPHEYGHEHRVRDDLVVSWATNKEKV